MVVAIDGIIRQVISTSQIGDKPSRPIRTDHRNLLYIHDNSNSMIVRWFMALSEYSYDIEFLSGVDNGIADSMSRLCRNNMLEMS